MTPDDSAKRMNISELFNKRNEHLGVTFNQSNYKDFVSLYQLVVRRLQMQKFED